MIDLQARVTRTLGLIVSTWKRSSTTALTPEIRFVRLKGDDWARMASIGVGSVFRA